MSRVALVVGINQYPFLRDRSGKYQHLKTPAADAEAIAQLLEDYGNFRVKRLPASNIDGRLQVDPNKTVEAAQLVEAIGDLFLPESDRTPEIALLFFAGHGLRRCWRGLTEGFLATSDACTRRDKWGVPLEQLQKILDNSHVQQQVIWLDCCFSGELLNFNKETNLKRQGSGCDRFFLAASLDYEVAYQQLDGKHGILTGTLLKGFYSCQIPEYEWITNLALAASIVGELEAYYSQTKIPQSPLISSHGKAIRIIQRRGIPSSTSTDKEAENNPESITPDKIFDLLLQVDFKQQTHLVQDVIKKHRTASFLVHCEPECGLEFLVNRLLRIKPSWKNNKPIFLDVGYRNVERLWTQLGRYFHLPANSTSEILDKICERWQTQDVIFIFNKVDCLQQEVLSLWLKEFWNPLVTIGEENLPQKPTHLFMFLVDHGGKVHRSNIGVAQATFIPPNSRIPLRLPPVKSFPQ